MQMLVSADVYPRPTDASIISVSHLRCALCSGLHYSLWLVLSFALRGFSPGTLVFPYPTRLGMTDKEPLCGCSTSKTSLINKVLFILVLFFNLILVQLMEKNLQWIYKIL